MRFLLVGLLLYLMYTVFKNMFLKPFRQGYANAGRNKNNSYRPYTRGKEGDVSIDYNPSKKKTNDQGIGEYVDYEEVD